VRTFAYLLALLLPAALVAAAQAHGKVPEACPDACKCHGTPGLALPTIGATRLLRCIRDGRRVELRHVTISGDLDLSLLTSTEISESARLPGLGQARIGLNIEELERDIGAEVRTITVVRVPIEISDAELAGRVTGGVDKSGRFRSLVVFLHPVRLQRVKFADIVDLSRTRFRNPADFEGSRFEKSVRFHHSRFDANAFFSDVSAAEGANFADTLFARQAVFTGFVAREGTRTTFARAQFQQGAAFHKGSRVTCIPNLVFSEVETSGDVANFQDSELASPTFDKLQAASGARFDRALFSDDMASFRSIKIRNGALFDDAKFENGVTFRQATFSGDRPTSFDRVEFAQGANFEQTRFDSPVTFVGTRAGGRLDFVDAQFQSTLDARRSILSAVVLGHPQSRSRVSGDALFDGAEIDHAIFDNTDFAARASFIGTSFGPHGNCSNPSAIGLSMANTRFAGPVHFTDAVFRSAVNVYHMSADPGQVSWRLQQIADRWTVRTGTVVDVQPGTGCLVVSTAAPDSHWESAARTDALRLIERNFRTRELLDDANEAKYLLEVEDSSQASSDDAQHWIDQALAQTRYWMYGAILGYGLKPWRLIAELGILLVLGVAIYRASGRPLGVESLDSVTSSWRSPRRRALAAWAVSLAVLTTIRIRGAYAVVPAGHPLRWFGYLQRLMGYVLLVFLGISIANTMPIVQKLLGSWIKS
jgi:uncharacterized protein YjbI with pentapeptide repeats